MEEDCRDAYRRYKAEIVNWLPKLSVAQASLIVSVLMLAGLISNIAIIPILERYPGRKLVRSSAGVTGLLYAVWLAMPWLWMKIGGIVLIKLVPLGCTRFYKAKLSPVYQVGLEQ